MRLRNCLTDQLIDFLVHRPRSIGDATSVEGSEETEDGNLR